jgi:hypothetical protein
LPAVVHRCGVEPGLAAANALTGPVAYGLVRVFFVSLAMVGLYLTYVGWITEVRPPESAAIGSSEDRPHAEGD